jgi:hypothetical protein
MAWSDHPDNDAPEIVAERFGRSVEWAREHVGPHRCVSGSLYKASCLVSDPECESVARSYMWLADKAAA